MPEIVFPDLERLFAPQEIAIVGASANTRKIGGRVLKYLLANGFAGRIVPVNPGREEVQGLACVPTVADLPAALDLAILAVPAVAVPDALEACGRRGCAFALIFASGFSETGADGEALQLMSAEVARQWGISLVGPNSLGMISEPADLFATFASVLDREAAVPPGGRAAFLSQSGAFGAYIYALAQDQALGIRHFVSVGNEAGLTVADFMAHLATDPGTDVICGYLEGVKDGERFLAAASAARAAGKQVAVLKVGRSERARRAIASHTAALVGADTAYDAAFERVGVTRVASVQDMLDVMRWSARRVPTGARAHRVAILTLSGGAGIWAADELARLGLALADLQPETQAQLRAALPAFASVGNPVDCTGQILQEPELLGRCVDVLARDREVDSVVLLMGLQEHDGPLLARDIVAAGARTRKPVVVAWMAAPAAALDTLRDSPLPVFEDFERALRWLAAAASAGRSSNGGITVSALTATEPLRLPLAEHEAKRLLAQWGIGSPAGTVVTDRDAAVSAARAVGHPVALKGQAAEFLHKTEHGLVKLGLTSDAQVAEAFDDVWRTLAGTGEPAVLVEPMAPDGLDVIVGVEPSAFGPLVMFGLGGIHVELLGDVVFALAPVSLDDARRMAAGIRAASLLDGYRGADAVDRDALAAAIVAVGECAMAHRETVSTIEINPLRVLRAGEGVLALDALIQ